MFRDHFHILLYHGFDHFQLRWLQAIVFYQTNREYSKLGTDVTFHNVYVNRPVIIGIEHKSEAKEVEYCRHPLIVFSPTNIGNNFITYKYISQNKADLRQAQGPALILVAEPVEATREAQGDRRDIQRKVI